MEQISKRFMPVPADQDLALRTFLSGLGRGAEVVAGEVTA